MKITSDSIHKLNTQEQNKMIKNVVSIIRKFCKDKKVKIKEIDYNIDEFAEFSVDLENNKNVKQNNWAIELDDLIPYGVGYGVGYINCGNNYIQIRIYPKENAVLQIW